ncbi:hypothetical protein [Larkinella rosea]|uniref:DUF4625 domain-containing protein n=1 Tax=Larkinella rosea TaxID=2025312 RepID=A0A3P1BSU4_9BACT|nr:hypothetical protein [Larkinella rosea]RRB04181.1 hypothetical protein EHT25_11715 [Larkinella rosea]
MKSYKLFILSGLLALGGLLAGCEKKEDPFVDRVVAPVLVLVDGASDGGGQTAEPVVTSKITAPVIMTVKILELDKSGILNNKVGIDSIPVASLALKLTRRDGTAIADLKTDNTGKATLTKTWAELGITAPAVGSSVSLTWTGEYKGQAFARLSRVQGVN